MRQRLYEWHLRLAHAFLNLTPEENFRFAVWQEQFPQRGGYEWPWEWAAIIGACRREPGSRAGSSVEGEVRMNRDIAQYVLQLRDRVTTLSAASAPDGLSGPSPGSARNLLAIAAKTCLGALDG